jgi:hypothetical protein
MQRRLFVIQQQPAAPTKRRKDVVARPPEPTAMSARRAMSRKVLAAPHNLHS